MFHCEETGVEAVSLFDGEVKHAHEPDDQMKKFIPKGTCYVMVARYPMVLTKTELKPDAVPEGHEFYHYMIDGEVYAGIFFGGANDPYDED